jgi:hypothetical protein
MATDRGYYRFVVKEADQQTFFLVAEPAGGPLKSLKGLLVFDLEDGITLEEATLVAELMNNRIGSLALIK